MEGGDKEMDVQVYVICMFLKKHMCIFIYKYTHICLCTYAFVQTTQTFFSTNGQIFFEFNMFNRKIVKYPNFDIHFLSKII